ncbi:response regulator transcription factor [Amycolatopsis sp. NPDC004368]
MIRPGEPTAGNAQPTVHIVDDDEDLRQSLRFLLASVGVQALVYPDAPTFLAEFDPAEVALVVVDVRMPGMSGFQLQDVLRERGYPAPMIFCSAYGDIPMSVRALSNGAVDFLEKPYDAQRMLEVVQRQLASAEERFAEARARRDVLRRLEKLTKREREVLRLVIDGLSSQAVARELDVSVKTIDVHRARIKAKTDAESLAALSRDVLLHRVEV